MSAGREASTTNRMEQKLKKKHSACKKRARKRERECVAKNELNEQIGNQYASIESNRKNSNDDRIQHTPMQKLYDNSSPTLKNSFYRIFSVRCFDSGEMKCK